MRMLALHATVTLRGGVVLGLLLNRPPDNRDQPYQGDLECQHQPHETPRHEGFDPTRIAVSCHARTAPQRSRTPVQVRRATGRSLNWVIRWSSATRWAISSPVRWVSRSTPNSSTLNEAMAVP